MATAGLAAVLAGCSGPGSQQDGDGESTAASPTPSPTSVTSAAFPGLTPEQILARSTAAARSAASFRVSGTFADRGDTYTMDMLMSTKGDATGKISTGGGTLDLRVIGSRVYLRGDRKFWAASAPEAADLLTKKWIKTSTKNADFEGFIEYTSPKTFFDQLLVPAGSVTAVEGEPVDGVPTVGLLDRGTTGDEGTILIAAEGQPYPLRLDVDDEPIDFSDWNEPVKVEAPSGALDIDG